MFRRCALGLLLDSLAITSYEDLVLTGLVFLAKLWKVAWSHTRMSTDAQFLATLLLARLFAIPRSMTLFLTFVSATLQCLPANIATPNVREPTRLVFQDIFATQTCLRRQEGTLGTILIFTMAIVRHLRVAAILRAFTRKAARRWLCTTR